MRWKHNIRQTFEWKPTSWRTTCSYQWSTKCFKLKTIKVAKRQIIYGKYRIHVQSFIYILNHHFGISFASFPKFTFQCLFISDWECVLLSTRTKPVWWKYNLRQKVWMKIQIFSSCTAVEESLTGENTPPPPPPPLLLPALSNTPHLNIHTNKTRERSTDNNIKPLPQCGLRHVVLCGCVSLQHVALVCLLFVTL